MWYCASMDIRHLYEVVLKHFKFFDKAAGVSVDVSWVIQDATPVS